jgi:hypothetical protein
MTEGCSCKWMMRLVEGAELIHDSMLEFQNCHNVMNSDKCSKYVSMCKRNSS